MNRLEYDWENPVCQHLFRGFVQRHTLIRYDARGNGMDELSLDAWVSDLETVVDASGIEQFPYCCNHIPLSPAGKSSWRRGCSHV